MSFKNTYDNPLRYKFQYQKVGNYRQLNCYQQHQFAGFECLHRMCDCIQTMQAIRRKLDILIGWNSLQFRSNVAYTGVKCLVLLLETQNMVRKKFKIDPSHYVSNFIFATDAFGPFRPLRNAISLAKHHL